MVFHSNTSCYAMISKRYFTRFVLTYEVLPMSLCFGVNGCKTFDHETLQSVLSQGKISDREVIVGLDGTNLQPFLSFSSVRNVGFTDQKALEAFLDRSYENYDPRLIPSYVLESTDAIKNTELELSEPNAMDKFEFSDSMALVDAVVGLAHEKLATEPPVRQKLEMCHGQSDEVVRALLAGQIKDSKQLALAISFFKVCSEFNIDRGWEPREVVNRFSKVTESDVAGSEEFFVWVKTAGKLINNEEVPLVFNDHGNVTLRAMTLVLLNPEQKNLDAMKQSLGSDLGEGVYGIAKIFVQARTGYSFLTADQRNRIGGNRAFLQNLNASLRNPEMAIEESRAAEYHSEYLDHSEHSEPVSEMKLSDYPWLTVESDDDDTQIAQIQGVKPMAGFDLSLVFKGDSLAWRIIDANSPKGTGKLKGQLALNMLKVQSSLPDNVRFEVNENNGVFVVLPSDWVFSNELGSELAAVLPCLIEIKAAQKSSRMDVV